MRLSRVPRNFVLGLVAAGMLSSTTACFGSFNLTRKLYAWNKDFKGKWVQELVFLVCNIVPVYGIAGLLDTYIINSIEFWTGENPVSLTKVDNKSDGTKVVQKTSVTDQARVMTIDEFDASSHLVRSTTLTYVNGSNEVTRVTKYADGRVEKSTAQMFEDGTTVVLHN